MRKIHRFQFSRRLSFLGAMTYIDVGLHRPTSNVLVLGGGLVVTCGGPTWEGPGSNQLGPKFVNVRPSHTDAIGQLVEFTDVYPPLSGGRMFNFGLRGRDEVGRVFIRSRELPQVLDWNILAKFRNESSSSWRIKLTASDLYLYYKIIIHHILYQFLTGDANLIHF